MPDTTFFRLLKTPIDDKGATLAAQIADLNAAGQAEETFTLDPADFSLIPTSPFAYWVGERFRSLFFDLPCLEGSGRHVAIGLSTKNDARFVRAFWEVASPNIGPSRKWCNYANGSVTSPFYYDFPTIVLRENNFEELKAYLCRKYPYLNDNPSWIIHDENDYLSPGITWPLRSQRFSPQAMPSGFVFSARSYALLMDAEDPMPVLAFMSSAVVHYLLAFRLGVSGQPEYVTATVRGLPWPTFRTSFYRKRLVNLGLEAFEAARGTNCADETTHAFCLPGLLSHRDPEDTENSLHLCALRASVADASAQARLAVLQAEIDDLVFDLYGLSETDRALVRAEMGVSHGDTEDTENPQDLCDLGDSVADSEDEEPTPPEDLPARVQNLLMWCVGVAFGRWDVRMALDPTLVPALQGPFDPLPRCAPGALVGVDGLPPGRPEDIAPEAWLRARKDVSHRDTEGTEKSQDLGDLGASSANSDRPHGDATLYRDTEDAENYETLGDLCASVASSYPLPIAWDGILVDDPTHPSDIVTRVRAVLSLVWGDAAGSAGAGAIEREACEILGVTNLRDYFRDPRKGFFSFHIKRYSKSRRKAPIYWLLQSDRRNYAIWLYAHRLDQASLYAAGRNYADAKVALEASRLQELRQGLAALSGNALKYREGQIEQQQKLVAEVTQFRKKLDAVALLDLPADLNDGVVISIAPLWELVPWKEAKTTWEKLAAGEYEWSTMSRQMRERGLVK